MDDFNSDNTILDLNHLFRTTTELYKANFQLLFTLGFLGNLPAAFSSLFFQQDEVTTTGGIFLILANMVYTWAMMVLTYASARLVNGKQVTLHEAMTRVNAYFWRFFVAVVLYVMITTVGILCFIIPGVYFGTVFIFAYIPIVVEGKDIKESFGISKNLVEGHFWQILLLSVGIVIFSSTAYILAGLTGSFNLALSFLIGVIYISFVTLLEVAVYRRLKEIYTMYHS